MDHFYIGSDIMTTASFYEGNSIEQAIINAGHQIEYLPVYSPDLTTLTFNKAFHSRQTRFIASSLAFLHGARFIANLFLTSFGEKVFSETEIASIDNDFTPTCVT